MKFGSITAAFVAACTYAFIAGYTADTNVHQPSIPAWLGVKDQIVGFAIVFVLTLVVIRTVRGFLPKRSAGELKPSSNLKLLKPGNEYPIGNFHRLPANNGLWVELTVNGKVQEFVFTAEQSTEIGPTTPDSKVRIGYRRTGFLGLKKLIFLVPATREFKQVKFLSAPPESFPTPFTAGPQQDPRPA